MENILTKPLTMAEIRARIDSNNYVTGLLPVSLSDMLRYDLEEFLDLLAERFVNNLLLMDITFKAVKVIDDNIILEIRGDVTSILAEDEEEGEANHE